MDGCKGIAERRAHLVELEPEGLDLGIIKGYLEPARNDLASEVPGQSRSILHPPPQYKSAPQAQNHGGNDEEQIKNSLIHQSRTAQLRHEPITKHLLEASLVMIEPLLALVIHRAYIDDDIAGVEDLGVARSLELWSDAAHRKRVNREHYYAVRVREEVDAPASR